MNGQRASGFVWFLIAIGTAVASDSGKTPFAPVPMSQRHTLAKRLLSYTQAFGEKDWKSLYDLVSDGNKIDFYGTLKVDRATFVRDMERTADSGRLINFVPVRTDETGEVGTFDIYGCGKIP